MVHKGPETIGKSLCVCMRASFKAKVHDLYHILQMADSSRGRDSGIEVEKAEEARARRWGGDGVGRNEMRGGQGPRLKGTVDLAGEPGLHSKGNRRLLPRWGICLMPGLCHVALRVLDSLTLSCKLWEYTGNQLATNTRGFFSRAMHWVTEPE